MSGERAGVAGREVDEEVEPVPSSTILLVRDRADTGLLEVLMLERHLDADFAGGALVFPGGKVAEQDRDLDPSRWQGPDLASWCDPLGVEDEHDALGLLVAAVRETFEEVGVLLAVRDDGSPVEADELNAPGFRQMRERLASRGDATDWRAWLEQESLVLDLDALALWSWWLTPRGRHRRFDTRFFVARAPEGQTAQHDAVEATDVVWLTPQQALESQGRGERTIIFPTRRNLAALAEHRTAGAAFAAARAGRIDRRQILPEVVRVDGEVMVRHPDEAEPEPI